MLIYVILIILPLYGLYKNSIETKQKKDELINKLTNLNDDLVTIKSSLVKESAMINDKLEQMKEKLQNQEEMLKRDLSTQKKEKIDNKKIITSFLEDIKKASLEVQAEKKHLAEIVYNLSAHNSNLSLE